MWTGIVVQPGGTLTIDNSLIEDAKLAIESVSGAMITTQNGTRLNKNRIGIQLDLFAGVHPGIIKNTTISCYNATGLPANALIAPYANTKSFRGINIPSNINQVQIGLDQAGQGNIIDNMQIGIQSYNTGLTVYNTTFNNITSTSASSWAIRSSGSSVERTITVGGNANSNQANTFKNSKIGVSVFMNQDVNVIGNTFNNLTTGIEINSCNSNNSGNYNSVGVNYNTIDDCTTAIYGYDVINPFSFLSVFNNFINTASPGINSKPNSTGIRIANGVINGVVDGYHKVYYISYNFIRRVTNGVWITNLGYFNIEGNNISDLSNLSSAIPQNGILAEGSSGWAGIRSNTILGAGMNAWYQSGIRLETTVSAVVKNTVQDIGRGLFFGGVCTGTETAKNNMVNNYSGIFLNWGVIGAQLSGLRATQNSWYGTFPESHIYSYNSDGSQSPMYVYQVSPQCDPTIAPCMDPVNIKSLYGPIVGSSQMPVYRSNIVSGYKISDPKRELYLKIAKDKFP